MFGFLKKKAALPELTPAREPEPEPVAEEPVSAEAKPELSPEQTKLIKEELHRHARNKGNNLDASIGLLHMTGDQIYLKGLLQFLESAEIGLLLKEPNRGAEFLILTNEGLRYLPVFSRPEHAQAIMRKFPAYQHVGLVNSRSLFTKLEPGMGLWINPGHSVFTYMMTSAMFTTYVEMMKKKAGAAGEFER